VFITLFAPALARYVEASWKWPSSQASHPRAPDHSAPVNPREQASLAALAWSSIAADMAGATIINATVLHNTTYGPLVRMTAILCAGFVLIAYGRRQQIKALAPVTRRVRGRRTAQGART